MESPETWDCAMASSGESINMGLCQGKQWRVQKHGICQGNHWRVQKHRIVARQTVESPETWDCAMASSGESRNMGLCQDNHWGVQKHVDYDRSRGINRQKM